MAISGVLGFPDSEGASHCWRPQDLLVLLWERGPRLASHGRVPWKPGPEGERKRKRKRKGKGTKPRRRRGALPIENNDDEKQIRKPSRSGSKLLRLFPDSIEQEIAPNQAAGRSCGRSQAGEELNYSGKSFRRLLQFRCSRKCRTQWIERKHPEQITSEERPSRFAASSSAPFRVPKPPEEPKTPPAQFSNLRTIPSREGEELQPRSREGMPKWQEDKFPPPMREKDRERIGRRERDIPPAPPPPSPLQPFGSLPRSFTPL